MLKHTLALLMAGCVLGTTSSHAGDEEQSFIDQYHMDAQIHQIPGDQMLSDERLSDMFRAQSRRMTICRGDFIPDGYVITSTTVNFDCGSWQHSDNAYILTVAPKDGSRFNTCAGYHSRVYDGFVIIANIYNPACNFGSGNSVNGSTQVYADKYRSSFTVCANSPIPANYTRSRHHFSTSCRVGIGMGNNAYVITRQ
ncbi:hypothetical protein L6J37_17550 [Photobacterium sp. WH77]|uniref:Uncharacterized protein n=1 Tax=Photobacterium arenosum TaxID=2774143 RepID=A0ABR9BQ62_9GAMM|nr:MULTISPECIES: hypothetical protein [Photobacterium]MBD8514711.1 hypothetical protein [Photobacterium arenosum]MCG2838642.1 hypothetical protein [Photobacterium sp. WH77]MCG2846259.1 hypothetical protein [Photobacterium sp. WH80]